MTAVSATLTITAISACSSDLTTPNDPGSSGQSAVTMIDSTLGRGSGRVEIELFPGEMIAREIHVEVEDDEEKLVSQVTAIDPGQGTITLELGGLTVEVTDRMTERVLRAMLWGVAADQLPPFLILSR